VSEGVARGEQAVRKRATSIAVILSGALSLPKGVVEEPGAMC